MPLQEPTIADILLCIQKGVKNGYEQQLQLTEATSDILSCIPEYLLTVNVAQELLGWKQQCFRTNLLIQLEYSADQFLAEAFPPIKFTHSFITRIKKFINRKGRIDICIQEAARMLSSKSMFGIELKGINPPINEVKTDLHRFVDAMSKTDEVGTNSIKACFCAFISRLDSEQQLYTNLSPQEELKKLRETMEMEMRTVLPKSSSLILEIETQVMLFQCSADYSAATPEEFQEYGEAVENTGAVIGVVIILRPN